jgi:hypothetical protein
LKSVEMGKADNVERHCRHEILRVQVRVR